MPYQLPPKLCKSCPHGECIEDLRARPIHGRSTQFRLKQHTALTCTFEDFLPGSRSDPDPGRTFDEYIGQFRANAQKAGSVLFGSPANLSSSALAKVEGDVFELLIAAVLWNAAVAWNRLMDSGKWSLPYVRQPEAAVIAPDRKVAFVKLPRNYDATLLFTESARANIRAHEKALTLRNMELGLSSPDIVGVRIPSPVPKAYQKFLKGMDDLKGDRRELLEDAYKSLEGSVAGNAFLFAIAVKRTTRSDRLYQPLFEANVLKYLIQEVLRGAAFQFQVHVGSTDGADVEGHYRAASLFSLLRGGEPQRAIEKLVLAKSPSDVAQAVLDDLPRFPL